MKILSVVGARPNFMKIAPICEEFGRRHIPHILVHTGQHYDHKMSKLFFEDLGIPKPDINLGVGSGTQARQTAEIMIRMEDVLLEQKPDLVLVVGDVNSTLAATVAAAKLVIPVAHVEAGLRSFDRTMPEEINRIVTDALSTLCFTTEQSGNDNLRREGVPEERIFLVGNTMIDTLLKHVHKTEKSGVLEELGVLPGTYGLITLHRPANVDQVQNLSGILQAFARLSTEIPLIFPVHPRTRARIREFGLDRLLSDSQAIRVTDPLGYLDFLKLMRFARVVFTDSGGIQEETTVLGVPCVTLRSNTERPVTLDSGTNILVGADPDLMLSVARDRIANGVPAKSIPPFWDGRAAERIVNVLQEKLGAQGRTGH
jgi:UDP-N-acetylglucosamine 2-epimerase (non-hydrolysing)